MPAARSLGRSLRIFKSEVRELHSDDEPAAGGVNAAPRTMVDATSEPVTPPEPARRD